VSVDFGHNPFFIENMIDFLVKARYDIFNLDFLFSDFLYIESYETDASTAYIFYSAIFNAY